MGAASSPRPLVTTAVPFLPFDADQAVRQTNIISLRRAESAPSNIGDGQDIANAGAARTGGHGSPSHLSAGEVALPSPRRSCPYKAKGGGGASRGAEHAGKHVTIGAASETSPRFLYLYSISQRYTDYCNRYQHHHRKATRRYHTDILPSRESNRGRDP